MAANANGLTAGEWYYIEMRDNGTCDVTVMDGAAIYKPDENGIIEYDCTPYTVRGVVWWTGLEADIRARFSDWVKFAKGSDNGDNG